MEARTNGDPDERQSLVEWILKTEFPGRELFDQFQAMMEAICKVKGQKYTRPTYPEQVAFEARRAKLLAVSVDQLRRHVEALRLQKAQADQIAEAERQRRREVAATEKEQRRFYNRPEAQPNFRTWAQVEHWTPEEALALLMGREPKVVTSSAVRNEIAFSKMPLGPPMSQFLTDYERLRLIAERAPAMKGPQLRPHEVVLWAAQLLDFEPPAPLVAALVEVLQARKSRAAPPTLPTHSLHPVVGPKKTDRTVHTTKALRRDALTPVIEVAQAACANPFDAAAVWAQLLVMAEKKAPPLIGSTEEGIQYLDQGEAAILTRNAFAKRLARSKNRDKSSPL